LIFGASDAIFKAGSSGVEAELRAGDDVNDGDTDESCKLGCVGKLLTN
jgi:hypothetical protein